MCPALNLVSTTLLLLVLGPLCPFKKLHSDACPPTEPWQPSEVACYREENQIWTIGRDNREETCEMKYYLNRVHSGSHFQTFKKWKTKSLLDMIMLMLYCFRNSRWMQPLQIVLYKSPQMQPLKLCNLTNTPWNESVNQIWDHTFLYYRLSCSMILYSSPEKQTRPTAVSELTRIM